MRVKSLFTEKIIFKKATENNFYFYAVFWMFLEVNVGCLMFV